MTPRRWKAIETWWALQLGGRRVPVTGRARGDVPDVEHPTYAIEVKAGKCMSPRLREGMAQAVAAAVGTQKTPLLCVSHSVPNHRTEQYVVMRLEDFQAWMGGPAEEVMCPSDQA